MTSLCTNRALALFSIGLAGCGSLIGLDDFTDARPGAGGAATTSTASGGFGGMGGASTSAGGTGGAGGASPTGGAGGTGGGSTSAGGTGGTGGTSPTGGAGGTGGGSTSQGGAGGTGGAGGKVGSGGTGGAGGAACGDTTWDPNNCGGCGIVCGAGYNCKDGACSCNSMCGDECVDVQNDSNHCGTCGNACPDESTCTNGACNCNNSRVLCYDTCVDLKKDVNHCGACGHDCQGGDCSGGVCQPIALAENRFNPGALATNGEMVFWVEDTTVAAISTKGGTIQQSPTQPIPPVDIAADQDYVYWTMGIKGEVRRANPDCPGVVTLGGVAADPRALRIAIDGANVYWTTPSGVRGVAREGGGKVFDVYSSSAYMDPNSPIAALGGTVFWVAKNDVYRGTYDGTSWASGELSGSGPASAMVAADGNLYWTEFATQALYRSNLDGTNSVSLTNGLSNIIAAFNGDVYWVEGMVIKRYSNGAVTPFVTLAYSPLDLAIDKTAIYWTGAGAVMKLAR